MTAALREWTPPLVRRWYRARRTAKAWQGDYPSWEEAARRCGGYDEPRILERIEASAGAVLRGEASFERDGVAFAEPEQCWPLLAALLGAAARNGGRLRVLDFGGSLGSSFFQHRRWLEGLREVRWCVVEQEHFARRGRERFQSESLRFFPSIAACAAEGTPDVVLLSSVLGYLPRPAETLARLAGTGAPVLLIDRTGFSLDGRERITVQTVPPEIYPASYPCRFLVRERLVAALGPEYRLAAAFPALDEPPPFAEFLGLCFERR